MNDLILNLPYAGKHSDSTLHFPSRGYILSYCEELEEEKLGELGDYSEILPHCDMLESASLCPLRKPLVLFSQACHCLFQLAIVWRIEVVEGLGFSVPTRC